MQVQNNFMIKGCHQLYHGFCELTLDITISNTFLYSNKSCSAVSSHNFAKHLF